MNLKATSIHLDEFMQMFHDTTDCQNVVSTHALPQLLQKETMGASGQMFGALTNADRSYAPGDFGAAAQGAGTRGKAQPTA